jgi:hypothetical protein
MRVLGPYLYAYAILLEVTRKIQLKQPLYGTINLQKKKFARKVIYVYSDKTLNL